MNGGGDFIQLKDLKLGMKNINTVVIVLEVGPPTITKQMHEVRTLRVADESAAANLSLWDEPGALLQPGDIVRIARGYTALWRGALTLYSGKKGDIQKIGEFCMLFNEQINMSEPQPQIHASGSASPVPPNNAPQNNDTENASRVFSQYGVPDRYGASTPNNHICKRDYYGNYPQH